VQHAPHDPYEAPQAYLDRFAHIDQKQRRYYSAMVNLLDDHVGVVVAALKARGFWDNLLWITSSGACRGSVVARVSWQRRGSAMFAAPLRGLSMFAAPLCGLAARTQAVPLAPTPS